MENIWVTEQAETRENLCWLLCTILGGTWVGRRMIAVLNIIYELDPYTCPLNQKSHK